MMKSLKKQSPTERIEIWTQTMQMMDNFQPSVQQNNQPKITSAFKAESPKKAIAICMDESDAEGEEQSATQNEINEYKNIRLRGLNTEKFDLLEWWQNNQNRFPKLYGVSRFIHAIPASSAAAERLFSMAGRLVSFHPDMRSQLVDEILFLKSNAVLIEAFEQRIDNDECETIAMSESDSEVEEILIDIECVR